MVSCGVVMESWQILRQKCYSPPKQKPVSRAFIGARPAADSAEFPEGYPKCLGGRGTVAGESSF